MKVYNYYNLDFPFWIFPGFFKKINQTIFFKFILKLVKNLNKEDIFHCHTAYPSSLLVEKIVLKFKTKYFIQHHGLDFLGLNNGLFNREINKIYNYKSLPFLKKINRVFLNQSLSSSIRTADLNIGVSMHLSNLLVDFKQDENNVYTLYNGVDTEKFFPNNGETIFKSSKKSVFKIGCVGNFWPSKNQITLLKAVEKLQMNIKENIKIIFIGTGPTRNYVEDYSKQYVFSANISFIDKINHDKLAGFYRSLDLFVLPSYYEALGCVYLEAKACGVPFIGVSGQGIDEWVPKNLKKFYLCEPKSAENLSELILAHYNGHPKPLELNFRLSISHHIDRFLKYIKKL